MSYTSGSHTVFHHRYPHRLDHEVSLQGAGSALRERKRTIIRQVYKELGVQIISGVLSREHVHMFVEIPPHIAASDFVRRVKGRLLHRVRVPGLAQALLGGGISGLGASGGSDTSSAPANRLCRIQMARF